MITALLDGARRVASAPLLIAGIYLVIVTMVTMVIMVAVVTATTPVPLGLVIPDAVESHLGSRVAADRAASGIDQTWWEEFQTQSRGVARTLQPRTLGLAAVLVNFGDLLAAQPLDGSVVMAVAAHVIVWAFFVGGLLDRLARQQRVGSVGFLAACGVYFFRFCRLAVLAAVVYVVLFTVVHTWLFDDLYVLATRDIASEPMALALWVSLYALFGMVLLAVNLVFDYAKIRAVVEDRRSMVGAVLAALRFVRRRPADVVSLYLLNGLVYMLILAVYASVTTGLGSSQSLWLGVLVGQAYLVTRLVAALVFYASQTAYFQSQLAHPTYVATPQPRWPSPTPADAAPTTAR